MVAAEPEAPAPGLPVWWTSATLGELFDIKQGKALSQRVRTGTGSAPFLRTANVFWGRFNLRALDQMDFTPGERSALALEPGDLLVCEGGEIGRTAMWHGEIEECFYQNHLHRLRARSADVDPRFVMFWMQAAFLLLGRYQGSGNKTTIPNLSRGRLASFEIPVPPLLEQRAIAGVLDAAQRAIQASERVIGATQQLKRSLMRYLFTYGPVPMAEAAQVPLQETEIGAMPAHWRTRELGELAWRTQYGLSLRGSPLGTYPILRMNNLAEGHVDYGALQYVELADREHAQFALRPGDVLFNRTNSHELVGKTALFDGRRDCVFASYLVRVEVDRTQLAPECLNYYLNWAPTQQRLRGMASRAVSQSNISASKLRMLSVLQPPLDEQQPIVETLADTDRKLAAERSRLAALQRLFRSLLEKLMTGGLRVAPATLEALQPSGSGWGGGDARARV